MNNYVLSDEVKTVVLKEDEIKSLKFENEKKKGQIEIIKVDAENNEIKLEGVTFEILDKEKNVVDIVITDENGRAITKGLPIDNEYTAREKETRKEYILSKETQTVILKENEIKTLTFENYKKKGSIKITKVSNGYSELLNIEDGTPLAGVKFAIVNSKGETIGIYETGENGSIQVDNLPYGEFTIYEYEGIEGYLMDSEPQTVFIEENEQVIELTFKDSPIQPELPKTGVNDNIITAIISVVVIAILNFIILIKKYKKMEE